MQTKFFRPSPPLAPFIEYYQFFDLDFSDREITVEDFPRTAKDIIFCLEGSFEIKVGERDFKVDKSAFISNFDRAYHMKFGEKIRFLHLRFKANGIYPLTKIPLYTLLNNRLDLEDFSKFQLDFLTEKIREKNKPEEQIQILETFLIDCYRTTDLHHRLDYGLQLAEQYKGLITVKTLTEQLNTNYRSLDRWFQKNVGLGPKRFLQITRFKNILEDIETQPKPDWMDIATRYDFHDQAHFIKEFKQFAGKTPEEFLLHS